MAPSEVMGLRTTVEPILMRQRSAETASETVTAGIGML